MSTDRDANAEAKALAAAVAARLREAIQPGDVQTAAVKGGIDFDTLARLRRGDQENPTLRTIAKAAVAARVPLLSLFLPPDPSTIQRAPEPVQDPRRGLDLRRVAQAIKKLDEARKLLSGPPTAEPPATEDQKREALAELESKRKARRERNRKTRAG